MAPEREQSFDPIAGGRARHRDQAEVEFNRIVAFSDGVFAIAITLVVLGLAIPRGLPDLKQALLDDTDDFLAYAISFAVLGRYWLAHHRFFSALERFDGRLMAMNLAYLACIALVPFTSQVLGDYSDSTEAIVLYAVNLVLVSGSFYAQILYSFRNGLIRPEAQEFERRSAGPASFVVIAVFGLSIPLAFVSPRAATILWLATFFVSGRIAGRIARAMEDARRP